jgi:hypothetical protein
MNVGMNIALILALALAATGSSTRYPADVRNSPAAVPGHNLNHNETLVRDTTLTQRADDWSLWLSVEQAFAVAQRFIPFPIYQPRIAGCGPWGCGQNHNETLVRDTTGSSKLKATKGVHLPKWVCGLNHNETLVRDTVLTQQADDWSLWLSVEQAFAVAQRFIPFPNHHPLINACGRWGCGTNHNETLVRDAAPMK